ncbi:MAG: nucleotidyltransferase [Lachnospiraceae bacterium]|nr:nucleotidyltransferase [Lachnospiraceae bacterium]
MKKYENYLSNLAVLREAGKEDLSNEFILSGIIDKFYVQFELGWKLLKELLKYEGSSIAATGSPRQIIKGAYEVYDFMEEGLWLEMLKDRNDTAHIYDGHAARELVGKIIARYIGEFEKCSKEIQRRYEGML